MKLSEYTSYEAVLEGVRTREVEAGVMNTDIAAFLLCSDKEVSRRDRIVAAMSISMELPVGVWYATSWDSYWARDKDELDCYTNNAPTLEKVEFRKNRRNAEIITLFIGGSFVELLKSNVWLQVFLALCVVLMWSVVRLLAC